MKKQIALLLTVAALVSIIAGCSSENKSPIPSENTDTPMRNEPSVSPVEESPSAPNTPEAPDQQRNQTVFESDYGYSISYEEDLFDYRRTEGYDEFVLKSDEAEKPFVFVCISHIGVEFVETVTAAALGNSAKPCTIGQVAAQCAEAEETWEGGKIIQKKYIYPLESGDALLIETQWYTEQSDDPYSALLLEIVNSITV